MDKSSEFITDDKGSIFKSNSIHKTSDTVIKKNNVVYGSSAKIKSDVSDKNRKHQPNAFPVLEGNNIVGFVYECPCGEITKIMFDFDQEAKRAAAG